MNSNRFRGSGGAFASQLGDLAQRSLIVFVYLTLLLSSNAVRAGELQVEGKPKWNFDGQVELEEHNLLTVEVFNNSETPWQGDVWLKPLIGYQGVDVPLVQQDLFLEPYGNRKVQFYVSMPTLSEFRFVWGQFPKDRGDFEIDLPKRRSLPVKIELLKEGSSSKGRSLLTVNDEEFPSSPVVLNSLQTVVLDHAPRWQEPQARAFKDWLYQGGELYLVADSAGEYPEFSQLLNELNEPSNSFPVGYGTVKRSLTAVKFEKPDQNKNKKNNNLSTSATLFSLLRSITTPDHNWSLIYFLSVIYLLILFPGCWLLGRKKGDFRITYAVILLTVGLFSFGFHTIGKRGYGEETTINCMVLARPGAPGRWVVNQWVNLFVTNGGTYQVDFEDDSSTVSTGQHSESVRGFAVNQPVGVLRSAVPSFSNRTILHAGVVKHEGFRPELSKLIYEDSLKEFELSLPEGGAWPQSQQAVAILGDRLYQLERVENKYQIQGSGSPLSQYLDYQTLRFNAFGYGSAYTKDADETFRRGLWAVIANDLGILNEEEVFNDNLDDNHVHVYFTTELHSDFYASGEISPQQRGRVVYAFQFDLNNTSTK